MSRASSNKIYVQTDAHYTHIQGTAIAVWNVSHNLGKKPSVTVVDSADTVVIGEVQYVDDNNLIITFSSGFKGKAYLN